jgi:hypothetical protein
VALDVQEIRDAIYRVAQEVRVPKELRAGKPNELSEEHLPLTPREKATAIEEYMVEVAEARGELEFHRLVINDALHELRKKARDTPWQNLLQGVKKPTQQQVADAKRRTAPDLVSSIETAENLSGRLKDQLDRLDKDHEAMSRVYTIIAG